MRSPRANQSWPRPSAHQRLNRQRNHCFVALTAQQFQHIATVTLWLAGGGNPLGKRAAASLRLKHKQELKGKCQDVASFL